MTTLFDIRLTEQFGRGLFAKEKIKAGKWVTLCEVLVLSEDDTSKVNNTNLKDYVFKLNENQDCIVLGDGSLFNHSDDANVSYEILNLNGRNMMLFKALKDIEPEEQLFTNYTQDTNGILQQEYKTNLL